MSIESSIANSIISQYEADLKGGIARSRVLDHARRSVAAFQRGRRPYPTVAKLIDDWIALAEGRPSAS